MAEPIRGDHVSILKLLAEMQQTPYYTIWRADARHVEEAIVGLETQLVKALAECDALRESVDQYVKTAYRAALSAAPSPQEPTP